MTKIKAIIFDMDGVLVDAKDWHYEALNSALELFGHKISRDDHLASYDGLPTKEKLKKLSKIGLLPASLHPFVNELKQQFTMSLVHQRCRPVFHHQFALAQLRDAGYKLAVASNAVRNSVSVMMQKTSLEKYLDFYLSNQDVAKGKPDPEIYNLAISRLNLTSDECVIVEDNENGLQAAYASGAHVLRVETTDDVYLDNILNFIKEVEEDD